MHLSTGPSSTSWQPKITADTTGASYWLNWRFLLCTAWVLSSMAVASVLLWKYEGSGRRTGGGDGAAGARRRRVQGTLYGDELWRPCLRGVHPVWLLSFRLTAFVVLLALLALTVLVDGVGIFYYYTQWTFTLITVYFAIGVTLSIYGCYQFLNKISGADPMRSDTELGTYGDQANGDAANVNGSMKSSCCSEEQCTREIAGFWGYLFQAMYQTTAGAVVLTDCVFWLIIVPFLALKDYPLNYIQIGMHSVNAIFLLGETALNSMNFPWFRIAYFLFWTSSYVIFEWAVHAAVSLGWPYPFLDLSSDFAPIWYFLVAVMHVPCYAAFSLIIRMKSYLLSRWFPEALWDSA